MATRCSFIILTSRVRDSAVCATGPRWNSKSSKLIAAREPETSFGSTAKPPKPAPVARLPRPQGTGPGDGKAQASPGHERTSEIAQLREGTGRIGSPQTLPRHLRRSTSRFESASPLASRFCTDRYPPVIRRRADRARHCSRELAIHPIIPYFVWLRRIQTCETRCLARVAFLKG
jgi:hypothetical protein